MEILIHEETKGQKRIYFLYPKRKDEAVKYFTDIEKKKAKGQHRLAKRNNPVLFEEQRQALMKELFDAFNESTPVWGDFKFSPLK